MRVELHPIEQKVIEVLNKHRQLTLGVLIKITRFDIAKCYKAVKLLQSKNLVDVKEKKKRVVLIKEETLPERKILDLFKKNKTEKLSIQKLGDLRFAIGILRKKGLVEVKKEDRGVFIYLTNQGKNFLDKKLPDEVLLEKLREVGGDIEKLDEKEKRALDELVRRGVIEMDEKLEAYIKITDLGKKIAEEVEKEVGVEEIGVITHEILRSGKWKKAKFRKYAILKSAPEVIYGRKHPLTTFIERIREIFLEMGFAEVSGPLVESSFWNFDALYQPQDHPARDLQDTFYLKNPTYAKLPNKELVRRVKATHENGWRTGSTGWQYEWKEEVAKQAILRTHTTAVSARYLAKIRPPAKIFCIGRVYRNETLDYKHLAEFHQIEGIVVSEDVTFRDLLGYLREFFWKLGFEKIRFRPSYFPYTEMSVEPEVYFEAKQDWIELGGAGIFRPEVTMPFGINCPVLAWGLSLERVAMLLLGLDDIRVFYRSNLEFLRKLGHCVFKDSSFMWKF